MQRRPTEIIGILKAFSSFDAFLIFRKKKKNSERTEKNSNVPIIQMGP